MVLAIVVILLALVGFADSAYFTAAHYGFIRPDAPLIPVCSSNAGTCLSLVSTPQARVFGLPNSLFGMGFYGLVFVGAVVRLAHKAWPMVPVYVVISMIAAVLSLYLAYSLVFKLHVFCPLCFTAQAINITLAGIFLGLAISRSG
ncbi:MAG: vitamin K epoxide reductase family protein [Armatimonadota bacterium]|nr:vitamin K epoxide reductase family protein [bacterium]